MSREGTVAKNATVQLEGQRNVERTVEYYNLDVIISVGYRVKSQRGVQFRIWASGIIKEYMKKGFALDDQRLKELGGGNYFRELLERMPGRSKHELMSCSPGLSAMKKPTSAPST